MRGMNKKILISLLTTLVVFITVFATTYAWVGIFTYANTDSFKMNLKVQDLDSNYFLTISSSGEPGTFSNEVPAIELQRQICVKKYGNKYLDESEASIEATFNRIKLAPSTPIINDNEIESFYKIELENSIYRTFQCTDYYQFDLYLSVDTKEGITDTTTGIKSNVYISNIAEALEGTINEYIFLNGNPFLDMPSDLVNETLMNMPNRIKVNSKNAVRFAFNIYNPISIDSDYTDEQPISLSVYQGGNEFPSYDNINNVYDLGGCLQKNQNSALQDLFVIRPLYNDSCDLDLQTAIDRDDLLLIEENSFIWNKYEHINDYLGCMDGIQTKMKISVFMWFEGWDSDCLKGIDRCPVTLNLSFTSGSDD